MEIYKLFTEWLKDLLERMEKKQETLSNDSEFVLKIKLINSSTNGKPHSFLKKENKKIMQIRKKSKI